MSLPRGAMDWSMVCDCGISWSYSFVFFLFVFLLLIFTHNSQLFRTILILGLNSLLHMLFLVMTSFSILDNSKKFKKKENS